MQYYYIKYQWTDFFHQKSELVILVKIQSPTANNLKQYRKVKGKGIHKNIKLMQMKVKSEDINIKQGGFAIWQNLHFFLKLTINWKTN